MVEGGRVRLSRNSNKGLVGEQQEEKQQQEQRQQLLQEVEEERQQPRLK